MAGTEILQMCFQITSCLSPADISPSGISYMGGNIFLRNALGITYCQSSESATVNMHANRRQVIEFLWVL